MFDPLSEGFNTESNPAWPSVPHTTAAIIPPSVVTDGDPWQSTSTISTTTPTTGSMEASGSTGITSPSVSTITPGGGNPLDGPHPGPFGREPKVYGAPEPGLISPVANKTSNGVNLEKPEPYLRVRITNMDRNRRDILIRFDAQVCSFLSHVGEQGGMLMEYIDQLAQFHGPNIPQYFAVVL